MKGITEPNQSYRPDGDDQTGNGSGGRSWVGPGGAGREGVGRHVQTVRTTTSSYTTESHEVAVTVSTEPSGGRDRGRGGDFDAFGEKVWAGCVALLFTTPLVVPLAWLLWRACDIIGSYYW